MAPDFSNYNLEWVARAPQWRDYYLAHDQTPHYAYMKTVLQILQWYRPRERWVLKSPQHLEQLGPLLATFPDATIVVTHRDPVAVVQSTATMLDLRRPHALPARPTRSGTATTGPTGSAGSSTRRCATATCCRQDRTVDVLFHEYMADEMGTLQRVYDAAGIELTDQARAEIEAYQAAHPRGKEGRVVYDLRGDFATTPEEVRAPLRGLPRPLPRPDRGPVNIQEQVDHLIDTRPGKELLTAGLRRPGPPDRRRARLPLGRHHRRLHAAHRQRAGDREHRHGLRGAAPQAGLRRHPPGADAPHHHDPGARRPRRRRRPVQEPGTTYIAQANNPACQADDKRIQGLRMRTAGHLVRHARHRRQAHRTRRTRACRWPSPSPRPTSSSRIGSASPSTACASSCSPPWARPSTAASCGCPSTASRSSATCSARCSRTSRTSTPSAATGTASSSPSWRPTAWSASCAPRSSSPAATSRSSAPT